MKTAISFLFVFALLVFVHEFGHFFLAKLNRVKVNKFALGMGPVILKYQGKETEYSLRIFPIGGYVQMEGEDEESDDPNSLSKKSPLQKISVLLAGPVMNVLLAIVLLTIAFYMIGFPLNSNTIGGVTEESPAMIAGLQGGDTILEINDADITNWTDIVNNIKASKEGIDLKIDRNGEMKSFTIQPKYDETSKRYLIGIAPATEKSFSKSISLAFDRTKAITKDIFGFFKSMFKGKANYNEVVGPVGMVNIIGKAAEFGLENVLYIAAVLSLNLAIFNLLPIPALDGSRIIFAIIELIKGSPVNPRTEETIHKVGFLLLIGLMVVVLVKDIVNYNSLG